jgi:signal transduction histidine kinase
MANGLSQSTALSLCLDREGDLWVGTDGGGLNRVKRNAFSPFVWPAAQSVRRDWVVQSVCEDDAGGLWMGFNGYGATYWKDGVVKDFAANEGLFGTGKDRAPNFSAVLVDRQKEVWVGTRDAGLFHMVGQRFEPIGDTALFSRNVSALHEDSAGTLWVGTEAGLFAHDKSAWTQFTMTNGLAGDSISAIADDAAGNLWVGTSTGLSRRRDGKFTSLHETNGLPGEHISALLVDSSGALWVGTRGRGLARLADNKWLRLSELGGLTVNSIKYLAEDAHGALWIGSSVGLVRIEKSELDNFAVRKSKTVRARAFDEADGLLTSECSAGSQPAAWRGRDGTMWFATTRNLVSVNPAQLIPNTNPPPVMIEGVLVNDVLQNTNRLRPNWPGQIIIPAGRERLEIRYTSLNLAAPDRARFRYQLEGIDSGWTEVGSDRSARYPKLPPDEYRFRVTACNEDGVWNELGATLTVIVEPPFWRTWWFLTAATAALLGVVIGTVHFISTQKLQRQLATMRQQEALERERARIARDLHDQLGANLTQVSLLGEMVETDKNLPEEVEAHAKQISQTARLTSAALDEIVWAANPSNDTLDSLVSYACKYAQEYFALAGLSYRLDAPGNLPATPIPPDIRHNVFLAFKESINNVVKHAKATAVKVRLVLEPQRFTFEIEDNGRGLPPNATEKGRNGLHNMRKRMEDVGGEFTVGPAPERGTLVRLTSPLEKNTGARAEN